MTSTDPDPIEKYLALLKSQGRSAPAGHYWDRLYRLITKDAGTDSRPALPLILGGSIASNEEKQLRLREHLLWAQARGCLPAAFSYLDKVPLEGWSTGELERWSESFSWEEDE